MKVNSLKNLRQTRAGELGRRVTQTDIASAAGMGEQAGLNQVCQFECGRRVPNGRRVPILRAYQTLLELPGLSVEDIEALQRGVEMDYATWVGEQKAVA